MNIEKTKVQMRKGVLEYCILSIIKKGDAYASDIIDELKKAALLPYAEVDNIFVEQQKIGEQYLREALSI